MRQRRLTLLLMILFIAGLLAGCGSKREPAGISRIAGRVVGANGAEVAGATVMARRNQILVATTDDSGRYEIPAGPGPYTLTATKSGYIPTGVHPSVVTVWEGQTTWAPDLQLEPEPTGLDNVTIATLQPSFGTTLTTGDQLDLTFKVQYSLKSESTGEVSLDLYFPNQGQKLVSLFTGRAEVSQGAGEISFVVNGKVPYTTAVSARVEMRSPDGMLLAINEIGTYSVTGQEPSAPVLAVSSTSKTSVGLTWSGGNLADSQYLELRRDRKVLAQLESSGTAYIDKTAFDGTTWIYSLCVITQGGDEFCGSELEVDVPLVGATITPVSGSWGTMVYDRNSDLIYRRAETGEIIATDPLSGAQVETYYLPSTLYTLAVSGDGSTVATVYGYSVCVLDLPGGTSKCVETSALPRRLTLDHDGSYLFMSTYENQVHRIDLSSGETTHQVSVYHNSLPLLLSPDDSVLYISSGNAFSATDLTRLGGYGYGNRLVVDPGGEVVLVNSNDGWTRICEAKEPFGVLGSLQASILAVSPDGSRLYGVESAGGGNWLRTFQSNGLAWTKTTEALFLGNMVPQLVVAEKSNQKLYLYCYSRFNYDLHYLVVVDLAARANAA